MRDHRPTDPDHLAALAGRALGTNQLQVEFRSRGLQSAVAELVQHVQHSPLDGPAGVIEKEVIVDEPAEAVHALAKRHNALQQDAANLLLVLQELDAQRHRVPAAVEEILTVGRPAAQGHERRAKLDGVADERGVDRLVVRVLAAHAEDLHGHGGALIGRQTGVIEQGLEEGERVVAEDGRDGPLTAPLAEEAIHGRLLRVGEDAPVASAIKHFAGNLYLGHGSLFISQLSPQQESRLPDVSTNP